MKYSHSPRFSRCRLSFFLAVIAVSLHSILAAAEPEVVLLWPEGAPGSEGKSGKGTIRLHNDLERIVTEVHEPTMTAYLPKKSDGNGSGIVIFPGGGHRELWTDHEGHNVARWLADHGIAAFVVYYRLSREKDTTYTMEKDSLADAHRAMQMVRQNSKKWNLDPKRVGIMGFSAGGELAALAGAIYSEGNPEAKKSIEKLSTKPAFQILLYPGTTGGAVPKKGAPDAFLASGHGDNDRVAKAMADLYSMLRNVGTSAEVHVFADAGHGFGLREANTGPSSRWMDRMYEWMDTKGYFNER